MYTNGETTFEINFKYETRGSVRITGRFKENQSHENELMFEYVTDQSLYN